MPWKAFKTGRRFCVFKLNASGGRVGSSLGCHGTRKRANRQVAALNIAEDTKEIPTDETKEVKQEEKAHLVGIDGPPVPISITNFNDLEAMEQAQAMVNELKETVFKFAEMAENSFINPEVEDVKAEVITVAQQMLDRLRGTVAENKEVDSKEKELKEGEEEKEASGWQKVLEKLDSIKDIFTDRKEETKENPNSFHVWKEADQYKWLASYSNNIRDNDNPPEIIASDSHKRFVEMVDKGEAPLPELWLWHIKEWRWGEATSVAYDDKGFACALGNVDQNEAAESVAEWLKERTDMLTSHGMPKPEIGRDEEDNTIIIKHITREISPLFDWAAANKFTGFTILKENDMAIPDDKRRAFLDAGLGQEVLEALEQRNEATAKEASEAGLETKEEEAEEEKKDTNEKELDDLIETVRFLAGHVATLTQVVKELQKSDTEKVAKKAANLPIASLLSTTQSLFNEANKSTENTEIPGPQETEVPQEGEGLFFEQWTTRQGVQ